MVSETSELPSGVKLLIAGGFGVGKTTLVASVSEIVPLTTEAAVTEASRGIDDIAMTGAKSTTTVALDFGRITVADGRLVLFLFGVPGQRRFWFLWNQMCIGALGVIVLVDTRRIEDSFDAVDYFENVRIPFIVAVNQFDTAPFAYTDTEVRDALRLAVGVPVVFCDARIRASAVTVLITLVEYLRTYDYTLTPATPGAVLEGTYT